MNYKMIHSDFLLNGKSYTVEELTLFANQLIQSNLDFEIDFGHLILQWFDANDFVILRTSGTTGTPKEIKLQKEAMIHSAKATGIHFSLQPKDTALLCLPTKYIGGKLMFVRALVLGLHLDFVNPSSKPLDETSTIYDFVAMVPMQVLQSIDDLNRVKKLIIGGAKLEDYIKELILKTSCEAYETYGMTETITHIGAKKITEDFFTVLPHAIISVDTRGCLVIDAPTVNPEIIVTNDLVEITNERFFKWLGRVDNVINSGGVKLFPEQIEAKLALYIKERFFVIGKPDAVLGSKLILMIEGNPYDFDTNIFDVLNRFEKPKEIQFVPNFKETATGKILRKEHLL